MRSLSWRLRECEAGASWTVAIVRVWWASWVVVRARRVVAEERRAVFLVEGRDSMMSGLLVRVLSG